MWAAATAVFLAVVGMGPGFGGTPSAGAVWLGVAVPGAVSSEAAVPARREACTGCHIGILADSTTFQGLPFLHGPHGAIKGGCLRCHGEHGETWDRAGLRVPINGCQACHHEAACDVCHGTANGRVVASPPIGTCVACHA